MDNKKKLPELKTKPLIGVPEEDYGKWNTRRINGLETIGQNRQILIDDKDALAAAMKKRNQNASWKASRGQRHDINSTQVYAYKGTKVGNARWGTLDLIDVKYYDTYPSLGEAAKATGMTTPAVSAIINGKIKFSKGFIFSKEKLDYPG